MKAMSQRKFFAWAAAYNIQPDPCYPDSGVLVFPSAGDLDRFWDYPNTHDLLDKFFEAVLSAAENEEDWCAFPRCVCWRYFLQCDQNSNSVMHPDLAEVGIPQTHCGAVFFSHDEVADVRKVLVAVAQYGWCIYDDLHVIPGNGKIIMMTDHHKVVHAQFADSKTMSDFTERMAQSGWMLPSEVHDETFKRPSWM